MRDIERAREVLANEGNTCVLIKDQDMLVSLAKGISPMLDFILDGKNLCGFSVADKIVGKAAALLFAHAKIACVFAEVLSRTAEEILIAYNIEYSYSQKVDYIINRAGTGLCPMEETVKDISDPRIAFTLLLDKRNALRSATK